MQPNPYEPPSGPADSKGPRPITSGTVVVWIIVGLGIAAAMVVLLG